MKILILGNSASGKSTLSVALAKKHNLQILDLDSIAWDETQDEPVRASHELSAEQIQAFVSRYEGWVIEGCYADLLQMASPHADTMIFMNLPVEVCIKNAKARPWEPHKFASEEEQDARLDYLLQWIAEYKDRQDDLSYSAHRKLFNAFEGHKYEYTDVTESTPDL